MVANDVFANEVVIDWPAVGVIDRRVSEPCCRQVIRESIKPDVRDVTIIPGKWDTPVETRSTHREITQAAADKTERLVTAKFRLDHSGMLVVPLQQPVLKAAESEEIILFFEMVDRTLMNWAETVIEQFFISEIFFARHAVLA